MRGTGNTISEQAGEKPARSEITPVLKCLGDIGIALLVIKQGGGIQVSRDFFVKQPAVEAVGHGVAGT